MPQSGLSMAVAQHICGQREQFIDYTPYPPETQLVRGFNRASEYAAAYRRIELITKLLDGRQRTIVLAKGRSYAQILQPRLTIVNHGQGSKS